MRIVFSPLGTTKVCITAFIFSCVFSLILLEVITNSEGENLALIKAYTQFHSFLEPPSMFIFHNIGLLREMQSNRNDVSQILFNTESIIKTTIKSQLLGNLIVEIEVT